MKKENCKICKKLFIPNSNNQKCCSKKCSKEAKTRRMKIYMIYYHKKHYESNKIKIIQRVKKWYRKNKEKKQIYDNKYQKLNRKKLLKQKRKYYQKNKKKIALYYRNKLNTNIYFRLIHNLRSRIWEVLKRNSKSKHTLELIGCSIDQLKQHLEKQFKPGMSWTNYGYYGWHVDHIKPCISFDLSKSEEQAKCFNYKNLQPLWAEENLSKKKKCI